MTGFASYVTLSIDLYDGSPEKRQMIEETARLGVSRTLREAGENPDDFTITVDMETIGAFRERRGEPDAFSGYRACDVVVAAIAA